MRRALCLGLTLVLTAGTPPVTAQSPVSDPDVAAGIKQVEEGDYDAAILTLDNAARRLAADPARARDLSQAYLYLGIAYLGKGHEAAAKAKFREAVNQLKDMSLSPDKFPPKVIDLFEAAKDEARKSAAGSTAPAPATPSAFEKKGGSKKGLILLGLAGAAAAGGAALALTGGEKFCNTVFENRSGLLRLPGDASADLSAGPAAEAGAWSAELNWTETAASASASSRGSLPSDVKLFVHDPAGALLVEGGLVATAKRKAEWNGAVGAVYRARIILQAGGGPANFTLDISGPCK